jgi:hypothetical protein
MIGKVIRLIIVALVVHALWKGTPVYWRYIQFQDQVKETARFAGARSEQEILERVVALAADRGIALTRESIAVHKRLDYTAIELAYVENVEVLPRYHYPWEFTISVEGRPLRPTTAYQVR